MSVLPSTGQQVDLNHSIASEPVRIILQNMYYLRQKSHNPLIAAFYRFEKILQTKLIILLRVSIAAMKNHDQKKKKKKTGPNSLIDLLRTYNVLC